VLKEKKRDLTSGNRNYRETCRQNKVPGDDSWRLIAIADDDTLSLVDVRALRCLAALPIRRKRCRHRTIFNFRDRYHRGHTAPMKTAISIPDAVFEDAERLAKRRGWSRSELYANAVAEYVKGERFLGVRERLDAVYGENPADFELDRAVERLQARLPSREKW
jgi:hypothetical protein